MTRSPRIRSTAPFGPCTRRSAVSWSLVAFALLLCATSPTAAQSITVSIANPTAILEGDSGTTDLDFVVTRSVGAALTSTADFVASNNSAVQPSDYLPATGTVTFLSGETSKLVTVQVVGETAFEGSETFFVTLSNPVNCTLGTATAVGTILNDDVSVSIGNAPSVPEGDAGTIDAVFTISLSAPKTNLTLSVDYAASNNSAVQPSDYAPTPAP